MSNSVKYYVDLLRERPADEIHVSSLTEYINAVDAIDRLYKRVLFRGQANESWGIVSSAYRTLKSPTQSLLLDYHLKLINQVTNLHDTDKYSGILLLAHLQHNGAKTCLVDYTLNPLISLWFACISDEGSNGSVYCIENSDLINGLTSIEGDMDVRTLFEAVEPKDQNPIYVYYPQNINRRIISQQSVFLISTSGIIDKDKHMTIIVPQKRKKEILRQLSLVGISRKALFPDFSGFIEWFSFENEPGREKYDEALEKAKKYFSASKISEAINLYNEAIFSGEKLFGKDSPEMATTYNNIALLYYRQRDYQKAMKWYQKALAIRKKIFGPEHPETAIIYNNIALVYSRQGDYPVALECYHKALDIFVNVYGYDHHHSRIVHQNIENIPR